MRILVCSIFAVTFGLCSIPSWGGVIDDFKSGGQKVGQTVKRDSKKVGKDLKKAGNNSGKTFKKIGKDIKNVFRK